MKKTFTILLICSLMLLGNFNYCFADTTITPYYNVVDMAQAIISADDDSINSTLFVSTSYDDDLDSVYVTVKVKKTSGTTVKTYNQYMTKSNHVFIFSESTNATSSGTYYFEYTAKCYKGSVLKDTVTGNSTSVSFTA